MDYRDAYLRATKRAVMARHALQAAVQGDVGPAERLLALEALAGDTDIVTLQTLAVMRDASTPMQFMQIVPGWPTYVTRIWIDHTEDWRVGEFVVGNRRVFGDAHSMLPATALESLLEPIFVDVGTDLRMTFTLLSGARRSATFSALHIQGTAPPR